MEQEQAEIQLVLEMEMIKNLEVHGEADVMKVLIFSSYRETLEMPQGSQRLNREFNVVVNVTVKFTRGGWHLQLISASGASSIFLNEAKKSR